MSCKITIGYHMTYWATVYLVTSGYRTQSRYWLQNPVYIIATEHSLYSSHRTQSI